MSDKKLQDAVERASRALEKAEARIRELEAARSGPIAIVGMGCCLPGSARSTSDYFRFLDGGGNAVSEIPSTRWKVEDYYDPTRGKNGKMYARHGAFVSDYEYFDHEFFGISGREASTMDPQQRMLLEVTWQALDDWGRVSRGVASDTGVFVGIATSDWLELVNGLDGAGVDAHESTGTSASVAAGRISYVFGFRGPAISVSTACSSSLVALHLACHSLQRRECRVAVAGGVNAIFSPRTMIKFCMSGMLAADGRCKAFDAAADGYVRGEGCGMLVLKRLADALRDGDRIHAVVRGSGVNQDGRSQGLTVPSGPAQQDVIECALRAAGIRANEVSYVEAHGTGTSLGDPIEIEAMAASYCRDRSASNRLIVGSVKTNIGHLEAAAGVAGLIKTVLALEHERIPPNLHFQSPSPKIPWDALPLSIASKSMPWPRGTAPRFAGISSFGFSGTNAHVILEEAPHRVEASRPDRACHVLCISARSEEDLRRSASRIMRVVGDDRGNALADICYSANTARSQQSHRVAVVGSRAEIVRALTEVVSARESREPGAVAASSSARAAFLFTDGEAGRVGVARELFETEPRFRQTIERCAAATKLPLITGLYASPSSSEANHWEVALADASAFAIQLALAHQWKAWGIVPAFVIGFGSGEYAAACFAGIMTVEDAMHLIAVRGRLLANGPGVLLEVRAPSAAVSATLRRKGVPFAVAAVYHRNAVAISIDERDVEDVCATLEDEALECRRIGAAATHSPRVEPAPADLFATTGVAYVASDTPVVSPRSGALLDPTRTNWAAEWRAALREPSRLDEAASTLARLGCDAFVEIGAPSRWLPLARRAFEDAAPDREALCIPSLGAGAEPRSGSDLQTLLFGLAKLYERGAAVDWAAFYDERPGQRVELPVYPFRRERFAAIGRAHAPAGDAAAAGVPGEPRSGHTHPLLHEDRSSPLISERVFESRFSTTSPDVIAQHRVFDEVVVAAAAQIAMLCDAALSATGGGGTVELQDLVFVEPLRIRDRPVRVQVAITAADASGRQAVKIGSDSRDAPGQWSVHSMGSVRVLPEGRGQPDGASASPHETAKRLTPAVSREDFYRRFRARGYDVGELYQWIDAVWEGDGEALCRMRAETPADASEQFSIHPGILDSCLQLHGFVQARNRSASEADDVFVPFRIDRLRVTPRAADQLFCYARSRGDDLTDLLLSDGAGAVVLSALGVRTRRLRRERAAPAVARDRDSAEGATLQTGPSGDTLRSKLSRLTTRSELVAALSEAIEGVARRLLMTSRPMDARASLWDRGMDSLMMVEFVDELGRMLDLRLPPTTTFDHPTIESLAEYVTETLSQPGPPPRDSTTAAARTTTDPREEFSDGTKQ